MSKKPPKVEKEASEPKKSRSGPLVNKYLNHPCGAYRWHKIYDPKICPLIPDLYAEGQSDAEVAVEIGVNESTVRTWCKLYPEFDDAIKQGRAMAKAYMMSVGRQAATTEKKINDKVWHILMRNCHNLDGDMANTATKQDIQESHNHLAELIRQNAKDH